MSACDQALIRRHAAFLLASGWSRRYIPTLKNPPEGYGYTYDPIHGNVGVIPVTSDGMVRLPEHLQSGPQRIEMRAPDLPAPTY